MTLAMPGREGGRLDHALADRDEGAATDLLADGEVDLDGPRRRRTSDWGRCGRRRGRGGSCDVSASEWPRPRRRRGRRRRIGGRDRGRVGSSRAPRAAAGRLHRHENRFTRGRESLSRVAEVHLCAREDRGGRDAASAGACGSFRACRRLRVRSRPGSRCRRGRSRRRVCRDRRGARRRRSRPGA